MSCVSALITNNDPRITRLIELSSVVGGDAAAHLIQRALEALPSTHPAASVAAQRVRRVPFQPAARLQVHERLQFHIKAWLASGNVDAAQRAIPSLTAVATAATKQLLGDWIDAGERPIAWSAVQAALAWPGASMPAEVREHLYSVCVSRLRREPASDHTPDLRAALVLAVGTLASATEVDEAAGLIASAFRSSDGLAAGAALIAARDLAKQHRANAFRALNQAMQDEFPKLLAQLWR